MSITYAQTLIVVVLIVVKNFGFLVITRDHGSLGGRHQVEMNPTDLPELSKPKCSRKSGKTPRVLAPEHTLTWK